MAHEYKLIVNYCNGRIVVKLNDQVIYDETQGAGQVHYQSEDLAYLLNPHPAPNRLEVKGYNVLPDAYYKPWEFWVRFGRVGDANWILDEHRATQDDEDAGEKLSAVRTFDNIP